MKIVLFLTASVLFLTACSSSNQRFNNDQGLYDTEKPTTYEQYRAWRKDNDPASERYAEYKRWEITYRQWKASQEAQ